MIREAIENVLKSNNPVNSSLLEYFLHGLSYLYAAAVKARLAGYRRGIFTTRKLPCKVISIGNITVGGTGKTPFAVHVAELIHRWGLRVAVISRGYKGEAERSGAIVGNGSRLLLPPQAAGDEPFLMAARLMQRSVPVLVGHDRVRIGQLAVRTFKPDVILLDDGFQHIRLARNVDVVLLDSQHPFGNGHLLPRGVLREPLSSLQRADLLVLTRNDSEEKAAAAMESNVLPTDLPERPTFRAAHVPVLRAWIGPDEKAGVEQLFYPATYNLKRFAGRRVFAFSGIAANDAFRHSLAGLDTQISGFIGFSDHHTYTPEDIGRILDSARSNGADCLCTTDKDWVKFSHQVTWPLELAVMGVDINLGSDASGFEEELRSRLTVTDRWGAPQR